MTTADSKTTPTPPTESTATTAAVKIIINPTFKKLIPPLTQDEFQQLEKNILAEKKIRDPLVLWNGTLIDGHNRYELETKLGIDFKTESMDFTDEEAAKVWIINNQLGRRNLLPYVRTELASLAAPMLAKKGKKNMSAGGGDKKSGLTKSTNPIENAEKIEKVNTRKELADMTGVSEDTYRKAMFIQDNADDGTLQELREGKTSIHAAYTELKTAERERSVSDMVFGTGKKRPSTKKELAEEREIAEQIRKNREYDKNHKTTIEELQQVFRANLEKSLYSLSNQFFATSSHLWADEENIKVAHSLIDEAVEATKNLKEEFNAKLETQQIDNPANDTRGVREGSQEDSNSQQEKSD